MIDAGIKPGAIWTLARYRARQIVKQRLADRGIKLQSVTPREVVEAADAMIEEHPELLIEAVEMIWSSPKLMRIARAKRRMKKPSANSTKSPQ
jgi:hypothetical protein